MTPNTQSVCKHCGQLCDPKKPKYHIDFRYDGHDAEPVAEAPSTGEPPEEFDMHITPRSVTRAARPSEPSAPQTSAEPTHKGLCQYCKCGKRVFFDETLNSDNWRHFDGGSVACSQSKADFHWQCPTCDRPDAGDE